MLPQIVGRGNACLQCRASQLAQDDVDFDVSYPRRVEAALSEIPESVREALNGLRALGGDEIVKQMAEVFVEYSAGRVRALQGAAETGDVQGCAEAAHALKGSARQLGLNAMADACLAVEMAAKRGDLSATRSFAPAVQNEYTAAADWLKAATA